MNIFKKPVSVCVLALVLMICVTLLTPKTQAATGGTCGDNLTWTLDGRTLTISGTGPMYNYSDSNTAPWFELRDSAQNIVVEDGVTTIGDYAFFGGGAVKNVTIGNSVTSIGSTAFMYCNMQSITLPDSLTTIGRSAFFLCNSLKDVKMNENLVNIGDYAFDGCVYLENITIPESVKIIGEGAFHGCGIRSLQIPAGVISVGFAVASGCQNLTEIRVAEDNPNYCSDETGALFNKDKTTLIQFPGAAGGHYTVPDSVVNIAGDSFAYNSNLQSVTFGENVSTIGNWAFYICDKLQKVSMPAGVTYIGDSAFGDCESLQDVYYAGTEEQWKQIRISGGNKPLLDATIHCDHIHAYVEGVCVCGAENTQITPFAPVGDLTGDNAVNNDDVVLLLWHTLFPEDYPLGVSADLTGDNAVNNDDVVLLLWHTLFPEDYPL